MRQLSVLVLSLVVMLAPSWSSGQSPSQAPGTPDFSDPNVQVPRAPRALRRPVDPNIRNVKAIMVKWKRTTRTPQQAQPPTAEELQRLTQAAGVDFPSFEDHGWGVVFQLPRRMSRSEAEEIAARIRSLPEIEYADPGRSFKINIVPNDPLFQSRQWNAAARIGAHCARGFVFNRRLPRARLARERNAVGMGRQLER